MKLCRGILQNRKALSFFTRGERGRCGSKEKQPPKNEMVVFKRMLVKTAKVTLYAPFVHSLKEKRMVVKSLLARLSQKFPVSAAEVDKQDIHQTIVIGLAVVSGNAAFAGEVLQKAVNFIELNSEAEVTNVLLEDR